MELVNILNVNGKFLSQQTTGVQRYAEEIVRAWDEGLNDGWIDRSRFSIRVHAPRGILYKPTYKHISVEIGSTHGRVWEQIELPMRACGALLFSPYAAAPIFQQRHAVTIHDAGVAATPQQYSWQFRAYCSIVFRWLGHSCTPIFTVSEFSRMELQRFYSISTDKVKVVPPGCDHLLRVSPDAAVLTRNSLKKGEYVLGVSSRSIIKNFDGLSNAFHKLARKGLKLAVAGGIRRHHLPGANSASIGPDVVDLGYVTDAELRCLYENAALFAYPSFYEGFGIPPVEAMSCGCPVLAARSASLPEACGDGALYCDPANIDDIANGMARILDDPELAQDLRHRGAERAAQLTSRNSAARLWSELVPFL
jgi:glycosyltransferase involved in cell wall biosynthesis